MNAIPTLAPEAEEEIPSEESSNTTKSLPENSPEKKEAAHPYTEEMLSMLSKINEPGRDVERQEKIIKNLPANLITLLRAHVYNIYKQNENYDTKVDNPEKYDRVLIRGELFEMLAKYDEEIAPNQSGEAQELLTLFQDPERYGLGEEFPLGRNPDAAYIKYDDEGRVVFTAVGEAKLAKTLNTRSLDQLSRFEEQVKKLRDFINDELNNPDKLEAHGLFSLAERRRRLEGADLIGISSDFEVILVVPKGKNVTQNSFLGKRERKNPQIRRQFEEVMSSVGVQRSAFSSYEVGMLAGFLIKKVVEEDSGSEETVETIS